MEVGGAALGLAAVDLGRVGVRQAVVGAQVQVDGQPLPAPAHGAGQVGRQGPVEAALQLVLVGQGGEQGLADRLGPGGAEQAGAGGGQRAQAGAGGDDDQHQVGDGTAAAVVGQPQVAAQPEGGMGVDGVGGEGILHETQASVLG